MNLISAWLFFPAVLGVLCLGCGLLVESISGRHLPGVLLPTCGLALIVVVGQFLTLGDATAELTSPIVVTASVAGLGLGFATKRRVVPSGFLAGALAIVFAVYAAPIVLSGATSIAGFIKLDDTATWLTFTDRIMDHGRDLSGLADSTYLRTLEVNIGEGYPIGAFIPFGVGVQLTGLDAAEVIQPYMAFLALLLGLGAWDLLRPVIERQSVRAAAVAVVCQPALLYGYYLWGGVKELAAAALITGIAALAANAVSNSRHARALVPLAGGTAALVGVLSPGGLVWLLPILVGTLVYLGLRLDLRSTAIRATVFTAAVGVLALPVILPGGIQPPTSSPLSDDAAQGNLIGPLDPLQVAGIWPVSDFRLAAGHEFVTDLLIALVFALAVAGLALAWRRQHLGVLGLAVGGIAGCLTLVLFGSPWVEGKAMATVSPFVLLAAVVGAAAVARWSKPGLGLAAGVAILAGVVWSNALAYQGVSLAPHDQFDELEQIADEIGDEGPTLMTEYSPYGARHFLRDAAPESVSELRYRPIPLRGGKEVDKGYSADTDELDPLALSIYRTLVLRRSPTGSRPPGPYELVWKGRFYDAWQRPEGQSLPRRLPLGDRYDPVAVPDCDAVRRLAAGSPGGLVAATGVSPIVVPLADTQYPRAWRNPGLPSAPTPRGEGSFIANVTVERPDVYEVWLGESIRPEVDLYVDGEPAGSVRHELNNYGQYVAFGTAQLDPGQHTIELRFHGPDLHPGSGGLADPVGPLVLSGTEADESRLVRVSAEDADDLCGREWDWIEAG